MSTDNEEPNSVSDEMLAQAAQYIKELLKNKRLKPEVRAQLEIQSYFLTILTVDHERISKIYPYVEARRKKDLKIAERWEKLVWIVVPLLVAGVLGFIGQFIYFWMVIVPKLGI